MEPTDPNLRSARNADELGTAALRFVWYQENYRRASIDSLTEPEFAITWDEFVLRWLQRVTVDQMAVVNRTLEMVLGYGARWWAWPPGSTSPNDVRAVPTSRFTVSTTESSEATFPLSLDVMEVHRRWLDLPRPRPDHPLVTVIDTRQSTPDIAHISHVNAMTSMPYVASEVLRRSRKQDRATADVELDGKQLTEHTDIHLDVLANEPSQRRRLYVDSPNLVDTSGVLRLNLESSDNIYHQDPRESAVPMVAWPGFRRWVSQDLWLLLAVVYGSTTAIVWTEEEGARLLARNASGGSRRPTAFDIERWNRLIAYAGSIEIWYTDKDGGRFVKPLYRYYLDHGRVSIDKPLWWRSHSQGRFTLTGAAHWARYVGKKDRRYSLLIGCMEYWLARSFDSSDPDSEGVAQLFAPGRGQE